MQDKAAHDKQGKAAGSKRTDAGNAVREDRAKFDLISAGSGMDAMAAHEEDLMPTKGCAFEVIEPAPLEGTLEHPAGALFGVFGREIGSAAAEEREGELAARLVTDVAEGNPDVKALCETYKLKREELGRLTGFSLRALAEWAGNKLPSEPARRRLREVRRLLDALAKIVKPERIPQWLHQTNPEFAPLTPLQVIELGEIDRLWAMVHDLGSDRLD